MIELITIAAAIVAFIVIAGMNYIPAEQTQMLAWMQNFRDQVDADPTALGLEAGDAAQITADVNDFETKLGIALNPPTRTPPAIGEKDEAKAIALVTCRLYAQKIKNTPGISDGTLLSLGLNVDDVTPSPIPAPGSHPVLSVANSSEQETRLRFSDSDAPTTSRSKPHGVTYLVLWRKFYGIGETPPMFDAEAEFVGNFGRDPMFVQNPPDRVGQRARYWARWIVQGGEMSPLSDPIDVTVT